MLDVSMAVSGEMRRSPTGAQVYVTPDERGHAELDFPARCVRDLEWYYLDSDGDMGSRSVHTALLAAKERGTAVGSGVPETTPSVEVLGAAKRQRRIRRILASLDPRHQIVLRAVYGGRRDPRYHAPWLGQVDPAELKLVLFVVAPCHDELEHVVTQAVRGRRRDGKTYRDLIAKAKAASTAAQRAYVAAARAYRDEEQSEADRRNVAFRRVVYG